jgi:hypothetical protein
VIDLLDFSDLEPDKKDPEVCKGVVFRGHRSCYWSAQRQTLAFKQDLRLLKKKSCPGCQQCYWMFEDLSEMSFNESFILPKRGIQEGKLYSVRVTNISKDWESGIVDNWDLEVYEVDESKNEVKRD